MTLDSSTIASSHISDGRLRPGFGGRKRAINAQTHFSVHPASGPARGATGPAGVSELAAQGSGVGTSIWRSGSTTWSRRADWTILKPMLQGENNLVAMAEALVSSGEYRVLRRLERDGSRLNRLRIHESGRF